MPRRGSPSRRPSGANRPSARRGAAASACAYITRSSATFMKKRSGALSASASFRCSRYPATMLALCARYQLRAVGLAANASHSRRACDDGSPASPPRSATVSHPSRSSRSLMARHHTLPGGDESSGLSTPRRACQRMNDNAARRNGRCCGAWPVGPWNTCAINARRASGSSRTAATCSSANASAPAWSLIAE